MKKRSGSLTIIFFVFLLGVVAGITITLLFAAILRHKDSGTLLNRPITFGDIKIWAGRPTDVGCPPDLNIDEALVMEKDGVYFLTIHKNKAGQINSLNLVKNTTNEPIFSMEPLKTAGKWGKATYSRGKGTGHPVGDVFMDLDFDGRFDFKMIFDDKGKVVSRSIYLDEAWQEVDHVNVEQMKAAKGKTWYNFDPNIGCWQQE